MSEHDESEDERVRWCFICGELPAEGDFGMCRACEAASAEEISRVPPLEENAKQGAAHPATPIIVNGRDAQTEQPFLSYDEILRLANVRTGEGAPSVYTVVAHYRYGMHRDRTITPGESCPVGYDMVIDVADASRT